MKTIVDLQFTDARGCRRIAYAAMRDSGGWLVRGIVGDRPFSKNCESWQAVERTMFWLRRHAHEQSPSGWGVAAAAILLSLILGNTDAAFAQSRTESPAVQAFAEATREYALLHRQLESGLPRLDITSNPESIERAVMAMTAAMRNARSGARAGEFFTDALGMELRDRIAAALAADGFTSDDVRAGEAAEGIDPAAAMLIVNGRFPWAYASSMFPCILKALPVLPPELQYRLVGTTLVLLDVHAGLIVDLLPYALADTER